MAIVSFVDNQYIMSEAYASKNFDKLADYVINHAEGKKFYLSKRNKVIGYDIQVNSPLSNIYNQEFYVVKFMLANIDTLHDEEQFNVMVAMFKSLVAEINQKKGYFNLRIPSHIVDMIKAYNEVNINGLFCGGTVHMIFSGKTIRNECNNDVNTFQCSTEYIKKYKKELSEIAYESFMAYQGQYHISPITESKAGEIYKGWLKQRMDNYEGKDIIVAEIKDRPAGFILLGEDSNVVDLELTAVDSQCRGCGIYKSMVSYAVSYAVDNNKIFVASTQLDNFASQGVWISSGLKPYYSVYNFHVDKLS